MKPRASRLLVDRAYDACEEIVRAQARNFSYGMGPLPPDKRRALSAIYAFARQVDDVADGPDSDATKLWRLAQARASLPWRRPPAPTNPVLVALEDVSRRFELPLYAFDDLLDGVQSDVRELVWYATFEELVRYSRRVAGSIGRLVVAVLGSSDRAVAGSLADDLGVALQLTNILRDLIEDRERGRVYLPREDLVRFGCPADPLRARPQVLAGLIAELASRNREWYARGRRLIPLLDHTGAACVTAMADVYERILERVERSPDAVLRGRIALSTAEKAAIAAGAFAAIEPRGEAA